MSPCLTEAFRLILAESDTRRQAATEFTRALMEHFERDVTEIIKGYISTFLQVCYLF
jgi:hypothetical protein